MKIKIPKLRIIITINIIGENHKMKYWRIFRFDNIKKINK